MHCQFWPGGSRSEPCAGSQTRTGALGAGCHGPLSPCSSSPTRTGKGFCPEHQRLSGQAVLSWRAVLEVGVGLGARSTTRELDPPHACPGPCRGPLTQGPPPPPGCQGCLLSHCHKRPLLGGWARPFLGVPPSEGQVPTSAGPFSLQGPQRPAKRSEGRGAAGGGWAGSYLGADLLQLTGDALGWRLTAEDVALQHLAQGVAGHVSKVPGGGERLCHRLQKRRGKGAMSAFPSSGATVGLGVKQILLSPPPCKLQPHLM